MTSAAWARTRVRRALALAHRDTLTGLPGRAHLIRAMRRALATARSDECLGLLYLDLDGFKRVNDGAGHAAGDQVLVTTAHRLTSAVGSGDRVVRLSGDEFAVLARGRRDASEIRALAKHLAHLLAEPHPVPGHLDLAGLTCPASVGVATWTPDPHLPTNPTQVAENLVRAADLAMYAAKRRGVGRVEEFRPALLEHSWLDTQLDSAVGRAVDTQALGLLFQPVVHARSGNPVRVEALLRFLADDGTAGLPGELLAVAEATGRLDRISAWVLENALDAATGWWERGREVPVAVNMSAAQLAEPSCVREIVSAVQRSSLPSQALAIEVHRHGTTVNLAGVHAGRRRLRQAGVLVVLEDVDSRWPLAEVTSLDPDAVTLSRHGVARLGDAVGRGVAAAVLAAAAAVGADVTAKGIETPQQRWAAGQLGCMHLQGDLVSGVSDVEALEWRTSHLTMRDAADGALTAHSQVGTVPSCTPAFSYAERASAETQRTRVPSSPSGSGGFSRPRWPFDAAEES